MKSRKIVAAASITLMIMASSANATGSKQHPPSKAQVSSSWYSVMFDYFGW
jgi:hypothetical protein